MFVRVLAISTAAIATLGATAVAARAQPPAPEVSVRVNVADLNLRSEAGAQVALRRIENAAAAICGRDEDIRLLGRAALRRACMRTTVETAVASAGIPRLTALNGRAATPGSVVASTR